MSHAPGRASRASTPSSSSRSHPYGSRSGTSTPLAQPPTLGDVGAPPPARPQSTVPTNPGLYDLRRFYENTRRSLELDPATHPLLDDHDLDTLSPGEHILISLVCTALNSLQTVNERLTRLESAGPTNPPQSLAGLESKLKDLTGIVTAHSSARQAAAPAPVRAPTAHPPARQPAPMTRKLESRPAQQPAADPDFPHLDRSTNTWYGNPAAYAIRYSNSSEAMLWREGAYTNYEFFSVSSKPAVPRQSFSTNSYAQAASSSSRGPRLRNKGKNSSSPAQVAASARDTAPKKPAPLPLADRRFFAPRSEPLPHQEAARIAATAPDVVASVFREANCPHPLTFTATVNARGALTLLARDLHTPATAYAPYYEALTAKINQAYPIGDNPYLAFRLAPNEVQLAIHNLPLAFLPGEQPEMASELTGSIKNAADVTIFSARFLQPDAEIRATKTTTSVVVTVAPADVAKIGKRIYLYSRSREVSLAHSRSNSTQCRLCWQFGHPMPMCKQDQPTCPLCSCSHARSAHRCLNPTCPK
ncbi:hypothetical protein HOY82DRAFT_544412, partial [Tuber indicum]